jgi:hypothetical protein
MQSNEYTDYAGNTVPAPDPVAQPVPVDMTMQPTAFQELRNQIAAIAQSDNRLGHVLELFALHLGHAHGLDPVVEDQKARDLALQAQRDAEDLALKDEAAHLEATRTAQDAQPTNTPEQQLAAQRVAEDEKVKADAEALAQKRAEEDALAAAQPAPVEPVVVEPIAEPAPYAAPLVPQEGETFNGN